MEEHLSDQQIEELFRLASGSKNESNSESLSDADFVGHLKACQQCQTNARAQEAAMNRLALLKLEKLGEPGPSCPPPDVWLEIAAGIGKERHEDWLNHAVTCDYCGKLLQEAAADFSDELTPDEEVMIDHLHSSTIQWQRGLAEKIMTTTSNEPNRRRPKNWWATTFSLRPVLACSAGLLLLAIVGTWLAFRVQGRRSASDLIADAYGEKRTLELRIEGAPYAPLRQNRAGDGDDSRMSRPALLKAEAEIARHLKSNPEDIVWLQASGRADLLEGTAAGAEQATAILLKARELDPDNVSVSIDTASAFMLRGQIENRKEDVGTALDLLGKVLAARPQEEVAQYNYALACEALKLNTQAIEAWQRFLQFHPHSTWAPEARQHLARLQSAVHARDERSDRPLLSVDEVKRAFAENRRADIESIDGRVEDYQNVALRAWLPAYFSTASTESSARIYQQALLGLGHLLRDRHQDDWMLDLLNAKGPPAIIAQAVRSLASSEILIERSDDRRAQALAQAASSLFARIHCAPGKIRTQLEMVFILQLEHQTRKCEELAEALWMKLDQSHYPWMRVQDRLEEAACASTSDERALVLAQWSRSTAEEHHFPILAIRAANFEAGSFQVLGDRHRAWTTSIVSLEQFWNGAYDPMRGYSLLTNLDDLAEDQQQWFLKAAVLAEAKPMIASHPDGAVRAFEMARLGQAQLRCADTSNARANLYAAEKLFDQVPPGTRQAVLRAETGLWLAKAELESDHPGDAVARLGQIRGSMTQLPEDDLQLEFYQTSGIAELRTAQTEQARYDLKAAVRLAENGLLLVRTEGDRWKWRRQNEPGYRALVELELKADWRQALHDWEDFKGATLRAEHGNIPGSSKASFERLSGELPLQASLDQGVGVISYAVIRDSAAVWVWDRNSIQHIQIPFSEPQLSILIRRFAEHCSDPGSNPDLVRQEGAALYKLLLEPLAYMIGAYHTLIIEPDKILSKVPFELLVDSQGAYVGDRYAVTVSPGIEYLKRSSEPIRITSASEALIIGLPQTNGLAPLPAAEQEAQTVAAMFSHPKLLLGSASSTSRLSEVIDAAQVFHFSGHATATAASSGLEMGAEGYGPFNLDGLGPLHTRLVVLSACSSALGTTGSFDDEDSLVRRLIAAHVPIVIASRWAVDSEAAAVMMKAFYTKLLSGSSASDSLNAAKRELRARTQFRHPYYWAEFSVFGKG